MNLTKEQLERYARNIMLPEMGVEGQEKLLAGRVLLVGAGGLGSAAAQYLSAAGVGTIGVVDPDAVELSNLQRQVIHTTADLGRPKIGSASERMRAINPDVRVNTYPERLTAGNALQLLNNYDFVIDATDNFPSKFLLADACHFAGKPYSHAGVLGFEGQMMTVIPNRTACYRCIFDAPPPDAPSRSQGGVLGVVPGVLGTLQAAEAIKFLLDRGELLTNRLLVYNSLAASFRTVPLKRNTACPLCGSDPSITRLDNSATSRSQRREEDSPG